YNNVIEIQGDGRVLGFVPDIAPYLKVKKIKLNPGDLVFACTEGMIESQSLRGEAFGKARIQRSIMDNLNYSSNKIIQFTCENLKEFTSKEQEADITCLVMKVFADKEGANGTA
ncbi:MAG: SpoIIE family protein phosphatase, partial [Spirochaetaceae bacterium]|nr:SpoIIE family protein phosphatase [Spirochaetaceae bacterium]